SGHLREGYPCRKPFRERYGEKGSACVKSTRSAAMVELRTRPAIERVGVGHPRPTANGRPDRSPADTPHRRRATRSETSGWNLAPPWWNCEPAPPAKESVSVIRALQRRATSSTPFPTAWAEEPDVRPTSPVL